MRDLEAGIVEAPDDPAPYLVYADWLQQEGDPRGELIVLQHRGEHGRARRLIEEHAARLRGSAAFREDSRLTWRWGFLETAMIEYDELPALLAHPSGRFLRELVLRGGGFDQATRPAAVALLEQQRFATLRALVLGEPGTVEAQYDDITYQRPLEDLRGATALYAAMPALESLSIIAPCAAGIALPRLRELIVSARFTADLAPVFTAELPALERLTLALGASIDAAALRPVLDATRFPGLRQLLMPRANIGDSVCAALATSRLADQLVMLDLSGGPTGDAGAAELAAGRFPALELLDVSRCFLTPSGIARLARVAKTVIADGQHDDGGRFNSRFRV